MRTLRRTSLLLLLLVLGVLACALPGIPLVDQSAGATAVAQTVLAVVQLTQNASSNTSLPASETPLATFTPASPTLTFTPPPTFTLTATLSPIPIFTVTPLTPMISVTVATNCRVGPGKAYQMVGALPVNRTVPVYARDPGGNYWYIQNPDRPGSYCWVWGEFAILSGLTSTLPIYTPPPTPTPTHTATPSPGFDVSFAGLGFCGGWWFNIDLGNSGSVTFRSINMTVKDTVNGKVVSIMADGFVEKTGCTSTVTRKGLPPGKVFTQSSPKFGYNPTGRKIRVTVTLCSNTGLNGTCSTESIAFTP